MAYLARSTHDKAFQRKIRRTTPSNSNNIAGGYTMLINKDKKKPIQSTHKINFHKKKKTKTNTTKIINKLNNQKQSNRHIKQKK